MGLARDRVSEEENFLQEANLNFKGLSCEAPPSTDQQIAQRSVQDNVNHPPHYNSGKARCECGRRIECIDVSRHHNFNIGNAFKYLWRADLKGSSVEDLRKAVWYIQDEIKERVKNGL